jgi:hypothetical protein
MFYTFAYTPSAADTEANPHELSMKLTAGVIHQVDILFQDGCDHEEFVQVYDDNFQLWPSNRGEKIRGNATVVSFREFFELVPGNTVLTLKVWTTLSADFKEILLNIGLLPKKIVMPFSFEELLAAALAIE